MTSKELIIQEIESLSSGMLDEALNFIRLIKSSQAQKESANEIKFTSKASDLLEFAGSWEGDDIRECLQMVHDRHMPLEL